MLLWNGECIVHDEFKALELELMKREHPDALVLVHPESPAGVVALADVVGSTSQLIKAVVDGSSQHLHRRHRQRHPAPHAPARAGQDAARSADGGQSATCKSCAHCPWMAMNALQGVDRLPGARQRRDQGARADAHPGAWAASTACWPSWPPTRPASRSRSAASCRTSAAPEHVAWPGPTSAHAADQHRGNSPAASADSRGCSAGRGSRGASAPSARSVRRSRPGCAVRAGRG